jgi:hypothetical protein
MGLYSATRGLPPPPQFQDPESQSAWESLCLDRRVEQAFETAVRVLFSSLISLAACYATLQVASRNCRYQVAKKVLRHWWLVMGITLLPAMWVYLGLFLHFRSQISRFGGDLNKDQEWSFGQVFALATWVPVVVEVVYLSHQGATKGMTSQMMEPFEATIPKELESIITEVTAHDGKAYEAVEPMESP